MPGWTGTARSTRHSFLMVRQGVVSVSKADDGKRVRWSSCPPELDKRPRPMDSGGLLVLLCKRSLKILSSQRAEHIPFSIQLLGELAVGRKQFEEH